MSVTSVFVLARHRMVREGLAELLEREDDLHVTGSSGDLEDGLRQCSGLQPDILLVDIELYQGFAERAEAFRGVCPSASLVVMGPQDDPLPVGSAMDVGASALYLLTQPVHELVDRIRTVARGGIGPLVELLERLGSSDGAAAAAPEGQAAASGLTPRELEVLQGIANGMSTADLAEQLNISPLTVQSHVKSILAKLGVNARIEAVIVGLRRGLVTSPRGA